MLSFKYRILRKTLQISIFFAIILLVPKTALSALSGDANGDGKVDGVDFAIWLSHYGQSVSAAVNGDFNSDNKVDGIDFVLWLSNYGKIATVTPTSTPITTNTATPTQSITFAGAGDIASCGGPAEATAKQITGLGPNVYVFAAGDNAYASSGYYSSGSCYDTTWGVFKSRTYPVIGTHEVTDGIPAYFNYFGSRVQGSNGKGYYSYNIGSWHILSVNTELTGTDMTNQTNWVKQDLVANPNKCIGVVMHMPRYSPQGGTNSALGPIWDALYDAGVEWTISAHYPLYERTYPINKSGNRDDALGIVSFRVGTGGNKGSTYPNNSSPIIAAFQQGSSKGFWGILKMNLTNAGYSFQFIPAPNSPTAASFTDTGSANCH